MKRLLILPGAFLALSMLVVVARADETTQTSAQAIEPASCVVLATSWDQAIKDAKSRNVPLVLHNHGFYCPPCWGLHHNLLCDRTYVEFSYENTVEVLALDRLQEGVDKGESAAGTYTAKRSGKTVECLLAFPSLTVDEVLELNRSKASSYNKSGALPFTAVIDPYTEEELKSWQGANRVTTSTLIECVTAARETLTKAHGKGKARAELKALSDADTQSAARLKNGDYAGSLDTFAAIAKKAEKEGWPAHLRERIAKAREATITGATEALDDIESGKAVDAAKAKKDLTALLAGLRGTGLEKRAKELLATLQP
jgi:hypothetical protein